MAAAIITLCPSFTIHSVAPVWKALLKNAAMHLKKRDCIEISIWTMPMCDLFLLWSAGEEVLDLDRTVGSFSFWAYNPSFSCPVQCSHDFLNNPYSYSNTPKQNERDNCRESEGSGSPVERRKTELKNSSCAPFLVKHLRPSEINLPNTAFTEAQELGIWTRCKIIGPPR